MNKILTLTLLVAGVTFMVIGIDSTNSFISDLSRFFTNSPTAKGVWMLIGGTVTAIAGMIMALSKSSPSHHGQHSGQRRHVRRRRWHFTHNCGHFPGNMK